jgi:cytochrome c oxidase subunit III
VAEHALPTTVSDLVIEEEHGHPPFLRHHFETIEQQHEAVSLGMWIFLLTEFMLFGGAFAGYSVYRNWYSPAFAAGSHHLSLLGGAVNTFFLITSSFLMAMATRAAKMRERGLLGAFLAGAIVFGLLFLGLELFEWHDLFEQHLVPGINFNPTPFITGAHPLMRDMAVRTEMFFGLFFAMTGLHLLHLTIGLGLLVYLWVRARAGAYTTGFTTPVDNIGLYWHFVDLVWTFLFPLLYLVRPH